MARTKATLKKRRRRGSKKKPRLTAKGIICFRKTSAIKVKRIRRSRKR